MTNRSDQDIFTDAIIRHAQDWLDDNGFAETEESETDALAKDARDWFNYNVAVTGKIPLIDKD